MSETKLSPAMEFLMRQPYIGGEDATAASEPATPEPAGPAKVVAAVATGSLPVSSAEVSEVVAMLERRAGKFYDPDNNAEDKRYVDALYYCANVLNRHAFYLRRQVEYSTERQPEENTQG